jgi:dienelactone hydrolase
MLSLLTTLVLSHGRALHGRADGGHFVRPDRSADVISRDVDYVVGNTTYEGFWSVPKGVAPRAGLLIAHQYMGLIDYEKSRAEEFAASGYGVFALDVYGKGVRCNTTDCAKATMNKALSDLPKLRSLINAGANQLLHEWGTGADPTKLVAMGCTTATLERDSRHPLPRAPIPLLHPRLSPPPASRLAGAADCFGGGMVLDLARHPTRGASLGLTFKAVSSIHGSLSPYDTPSSEGEIQSRIQAHHAELDFQGDAGLAKLEAEMKVGVTNSDAIWETIKYSKCEHGWTEPGTPVYNGRAAVQAHKSTFNFFQEALGIEDPEADPFPPVPICQAPTTAR